MILPFLMIIFGSIGIINTPVKQPKFSVPFKSGFTLSHTPPRSEKEAINWRNRRILSWSDFKGAPIESSDNAALTSTSILINYGYDENELSYQLKCIFYPHKSWTKVEKVYILAHEQGHFDISQLYTRKLHKALSEYKFRHATVEKDIQLIYQRITQEQAGYQQLYDKETNHSRHRDKQVLWQQIIEDQLDSLKQYANYPQ